MSPTLLRLVLFVSCAHALVHVFELALPSVEQLVAAEFGVDKQVTGRLATAFRLPFGLMALAVGWLADRWGPRRMLVVYLWGAAGTALLVAGSGSLAQLFPSMLLLGIFASIYHPAGLALLAQETTPATRPRALGLHGVFGSAGIGAAPFAAGLLLSIGTSWRGYFALLSLPALLLGAWFLWRLPAVAEDSSRHSHPASTSDGDGRWGAFFTLTLLGAVNGFVYAAFLTFLPRYLDASIGEARLGAPLPAVGVRNYLAGSVLLLGMVGQYAAGRLARPGRLEVMLAGVLLATAPLLAWMAVARGPGRVWAAGLFALVHFMNQPLYNSLIANYVPRRRRSLGYGFSFMMAFGVGSFGATFAGESPSDGFTYGVLAALAATAGVAAIGLHLASRPSIGGE